MDFTGIFPASPAAGSQGSLGIIQLDVKHSVGWDTPSVHTPPAVPNVEPLPGEEAHSHFPAPAPAHTSHTSPSGMLSAPLTGSK